MRSTQLRRILVCFICLCVAFALLKILFSNDSSQFGFDSNLPPIDAVITYVNGDDPEFAKLLIKHKRGLVKRENVSSTPNRFADNSDLKYLLRSLAIHGQIFRYIFLVVAFESQIPQWLNRSNPQLRIVYHSDIWYNTKDLPVFNALAVAANLHHIRDLSNVFVYFNDDFFVIKNLQMADFVDLHANSSVKSIVVRPSRSLKKFSEKDDVSSSVIAKETAESVCNLNEVQNIIGYDQWVQHTPHVLIRDVLHKAESIPNVIKALETTWKSKFRMGSEMHIVTFFIHFAQCYSKLSATVGNENESAYIPLTGKLISQLSPEEIAERKNVQMRITAGLVKYVCFNDEIVSAVRNGSADTVGDVMYRWRSQLFPRKCAHER